MTTFVKRRKRALSAVLVAVILLAVAALINAQEPFPTQMGAGTTAPQDRATIEMNRRQAKVANEKRQNDLKRDTDHLLELATQLKQEVDKTNEYTLSLDVMKKAEEIEKLAHSVKEKMKGH